MRRISFNRPNEKVRGIQRRLRSLDAWADSFEGYFPVDQASAYVQGLESEKYWNWKLPVLDRLVNPPTTNAAIQQHCAQAILRACQHISKAKPAKFNNAIVTALITFPEMFSSEICVFFDKAYFKSFYQRSGEWQSLSPIDETQLSEFLSFSVPSDFSEKGFLFQTKDEWEGEVSTFEEEWWCYSDSSKG